MSHSVFVTGATGYMGRHLIPLLVSRGHKVRALARQGSEHKIPASVSKTVADPLKMDSYTGDVRGSDTFIHLIGVPHPSPAKAGQFRSIDHISIRVREIIHRVVENISVEVNVRTKSSWVLANEPSS